MDCFNMAGAILLDKFLNTKISSSNPNLEIVFFKLDVYFAWAIAVNPFCVSNKKDSQIGTFRIIIDK